MIIQAHQNATIKDTPSVVDARFIASVYPINNNILSCVKNCLLAGPTVVICSGSWRLDLDAIYIESKVFQATTISYPPKTYFTDLGNKHLISCVLDKMQPTNIAFVHSGFFTSYRKIQNIMQDIEWYAQYGKQVIMSSPTNKFDFNRLTTPLAQLAQDVGGFIVEDSIIVQRKT